MRRIFVAIALMLSMVCALAVSTHAAAITTFTDESDFKASLSSFNTYDFDSFNNGGAWLAGEDLIDQISGIHFDNAIINEGAYGGTSQSSPNVVLNKDIVNPIVFTFDTPVFAVGLFNTSIGDAERFEIYDTDETLLASINLPHNYVNFGGFISDVRIAKGVVVPIAPTNGSIYIDDLTIGTPVPIPGAIWLFGCGLIGIAGFRRKLTQNFGDVVD